MSMTDSTDTGAGFIVGADPKEPPRTAADWSEVANQTVANNPLAQQPGIQVPAPQPEEQPQQQVESPRYTDDDIERIRREEKDKLYGRIEKMDEELKALRKEREEVEAARQAEIEAKAAEAKRLEEEQMETKELLERRTQEWESRLQEVQQNYERDRAIFEMERRAQELDRYRQERIAQESEYIMPELRDLVTGNDENEIDASIEMVKAKTAAIVGQIQSNLADQRQSMRGAAPTAPPVGPLEQASTMQTLTPEDIAGMDMETYRKYRGELLNATSRAYGRG